MIGAWIGFAFGAIAGLAVDVVIQTGSGVAIAGYVADDEEVPDCEGSSKWPGAAQSA